MAAPHAAGRGWNNLPTELKVEILSYNIVASLPLTYEDFEIIPADHGAINPYPDRADSKYHLVADMVCESYDTDLADMLADCTL